ncbi:hypothetical protein cand_003370, partial [Cryptosporidium andersoni]
MLFGASLIKALFRNILEKFGSDILGNWNLSENIEIHSFSPLDLELSNFPVPQILFDIAELPFVIVYSNIGNIRICVNSDQIVSKSNPINIEVKNVDIQVRLANPDEWNISKWSKKILKSKKKRLREWEKFVSPWSTKLVDNSLTQSIETSIVNSLVINAYNIHAYIMDDDIGDSPFTFEILADTLKINSPYNSLDLRKQEKDGLNSNLFQFLWIRFYGFRIIYKKFSEYLLCSISKNITPSKQYEDNLTVEVENNNKSLLSFLQNLIPFIRSDNQYSNEKLSALDYLCCSFGIRSPLKELNIHNGNKKNVESVSFENSTIGDINKGKKTSSTMNLFNPKHTQNGNSKFIDIPDNCLHAIELTPDIGIEMHILFQRWDIRALKAPISMFPLSYETQEDVINFISSCKWKVSKLIFLPKSNLYTGSQPPNTKVGSNSPLELTFTIDALNALFNFINYINEWTSFLKAIQAIYYNRKTRTQMESYLVSMINANMQNYTISGISNFSASLLSSLEDELPINDIISLHVAANYYVKEKLASLHQLWIPCSNIEEISLLSVQEFLNELETKNKDISNLSNNGSYNKVEYFRHGDISTFKHWFDFDSGLEVAIPNIRCNILLTAIDDMDANIRPFPSWIKSLIVCNLNSGVSKQKIVNLLGICSTIVIDGTIYMMSNKITFCHREINIKLGNFSIYEREIGLISVRANLNRTTLDIDEIYLDKKHEQQDFKSLQKFTSIVLNSINLDFLPCFRILNIDSVPIAKVNTKANNWNSYLIPDFVYTDDNSNRNNRHISNFISIRLHQFYSSVDLTHMRNQLLRNSLGSLIQDNYVVNKESNGHGFNYIYIGIPNLNISSIKAMWRLSNIFPLCKSKIGHLLKRCKKTYETDLIRSLFAMIKVITKQNEKITINLRCLTISSLFPPDETFTTFSVADLFYIKEKQISSTNLDNIRETQMYKDLLKNKDLSLNNNQSADFALFKVESCVKVPRLDNEIVEHIEDTNTSEIYPDNLENKVLMIIGDICSRPNFFINNLKSYHIMESSQSVCKDDNKVFWSMEDLKIPFDTLDSSESLLYNDILQYFLQNGYIIELSTCMSGCKLLLEHLFMEILFSDISLVVSLRHLGISSILSNRLEMYILDIRDLFLHYKGLTMDLKLRLICIQINLTPISVALLSGYDFLIFPMQGVTDLPKLFAKLASFSDEEIKKKKAIEKSSKSLLSLLQNLSLSIQFLGLHVYDSNSLAFDFMLYSISLNYKYSSLNQVLKFIFNLGEIYIQHLHSISLDFNPDSRYSWDKELTNHDELVVPSVIFCKYAGHLVPHRSPLNTVKDSTLYVFICANHDTQELDLSDYSLNNKKSSQTPQIYLEAQFKIEDSILNNKSDNHDTNATNINICASEVKENNSSVNINVAKTEISERTYHNKINFKVFAGHIFFSYEIACRIQKVLNDYKNLVSIYKSEKNILWSSQFTDNIVSPILLAKAVGKKDEIEEKSSDNILLDTNFTNYCGYNPNSLTNSSNNSYIFDWCIVLENITLHTLLGIEQLLYEGNNIENRLLDIHRKSLQYSGDSFTIIRPLYCYNKKSFNSNFYNPRIAILTAESIGVRISSFTKITFKNIPGNIGDCLNSGISIAPNDKFARDLRSWTLYLLIREIDIMILRNGTWGILDFSFRRVKLLLKSHNNEPVVSSSKDLNIINILNEFNQRSIKSLLHSNISNFKYIKFTIRDFCIWSILYERNRCNFSSKSSKTSGKETSNMGTGTNIFDMFYTNIDFSLEYVCLTPERNALSEYSSILLPEFTTIEKYREIEDTAENANNLVLPGWSYGLILPPQTPFSDKMYLQNSIPKLFPVFGKRPIPRSNLDSSNNKEIGKSKRVQTYTQGTDLPDSNSKLNRQLFKKDKKRIIQVNSGKFCNETEGMQILPLFSLEALDQDICNTDRSINASVIISPTFMTLLPNFFRQLIDIFHFINKFMNFKYQAENGISVDKSETNSEDSKDENLRNIPITTSTSLQSNNVTTLSSNNLLNRDIKMFPDDLCISDEAYTSESCGTSDAILDILEKIKVIPLSSISLKAQLHTMVITFPEFHDTILTQSISSEHFDGFNYSPSRNRYLVATFPGIYKPAIAVKCNFNICYLKLNNDELIGSENTTSNDGQANSAKLEFDISNIRLQFPYVQNIGENFVFEESSSLQGMRNYKSSNKSLFCPILDIFVPSIHSCFILTKIITCSSSIQADHDELSDSENLSNLNETGVVLGSLSISSIFAFDAAEIPIIENTHLIRNSILGDHIKNVCVNQQGKGYSNGIINSYNPEGNVYFDDSELMTMDSQILSISFNLKGLSMESQLEIKCFRFMFSLTTVNLSVPYIQRVLSWWNDLWTIRIRFPRCTNSTMRYFLVDMCSDKLYSSSYGLTTRSQNSNQYVKLSDFPIKNSEFCNSVYTVNIYDYWQHELTNPLYFPLDVSVPIVLALPPTSILVPNVRPYNAIRRTNNFTPSLLNSYVKYYDYEFRFKKLMNSKQILSISGNSSLTNVEKLRNICFTSKLTERIPTLSEISKILTGISNSRETVGIGDNCNPVYKDDYEEFGDYPSRSQIGENKDRENKNSLSIHTSEEDTDKVVSNSVDYHLLNSAMSGIHKMVKIVRYPIIYSWSTIRQKLLSTDKSNLTTNIGQNLGSVNEFTKVVDEINLSNVNDNFLGYNGVNSKEELSRTNNNSIENIKCEKLDNGPAIDEPDKLNFGDDKLAKFKVLSTISKKISKVGKSRWTKSRDYNTYSSGDYLNNEDSNECTQLAIENVQTTQRSKQRLNIQVIIENLEIWIHRDVSLEKSGDMQIIKDSEVKNSNTLSSKRYNKKLPPELTLEEAAIDWIAKSVYYVPPVKRRNSSINESSSELLLNKNTNMSMELKEYKFDDGNIELHSTPEGYQYNPFYQNLLGSNQGCNEDDNESACSYKQPTLEYGTRILFPNTFEIYNFRRNIGHYDQTSFDYIMKSNRNRYGRRQTLAVHRDTRASSNSHIFPIRNSFKGSYNTNFDFDNVSKSENFNSSGIFRNSDRINSNSQGLTEICRHNKYKSYENNIKSLGTAFSILISMNIAIDITEYDFQASANCNELRILPGFPISLNNKTLFSRCNISPKYEKDGESIEPIESNLQFSSVPNNCNYNYYSIMFQKKWLTIVSLNGGNIYMPLASSLPSSVKRDFLLYLNGAKLSVRPCYTLRSKRSDSWTSYETNVELYIGEVTISLSMDLIRELHIYKEYLYSIKSNIDKYTLHHPKHIYSYISPESILCPYIHTDSFDVFKDSGTPTGSTCKNKGRSSIVRQPLPLMINPTEPEDKIRCITSQVSIVEATEEIKYQLEVSDEEQLRSSNISRYSGNKDVTDRELDSQVTSSEDEEDNTSSICENHVVLLIYSGFPLPSSRSYYLPESTKIHLQEQVKKVNYERHSNRRFGIFVSEDLNWPNVEMYKGGNGTSSGNKSLISDHLLYSSISKIIRLTSISLEWLMAKKYTENSEKTMRKKNILYLLKVHWDKCNQFIFEYNQPCFDVIIYNDYTDLLRFSVETSHGIAQYPNALNCKFKSTISTITHDPVIDCMITIIRPFLVNLDISLQDQAESLNVQCKGNSTYPNLNYSQTYMDKSLLRCQIMLINLRTESISLEITSGFLQNIKLVISDLENFNLLGLVYAYQRKIHTVKIINDMGQSTLLVQPIYSIGDYPDIVNDTTNPNYLKFANYLDPPYFADSLGYKGISMSGSSIKGLGTKIINRNEYCHAAVYLPIYLAIQKFIHRKGQKIAARLQAMENSDNERYLIKLGDISEKTNPDRSSNIGPSVNRMNVSSEIKHYEISIPQATSAMIMHNTQGIVSNSTNSAVNCGESIKDYTAIQNKSTQITVKKKGKKNVTQSGGKSSIYNSSVILNDITKEIYRLGDTSKSYDFQGSKHMWLSGKMYDLLYGSTRIVESEFYQLAEQLELATPYLGGNGGIETIIHRFFLTQPIWSLVGRMKDDTMHMRSYRFGTLGFLVVLEPEPGANANEWIWTLGTCVQIENSTNITLRIMVTWRHGIRRFCGALFTDSDKGINARVENGSHIFPCIDIPPFSRRSIPLSWFLLGDMEPIIVPVLTKTIEQEDEDDQHLLNIEDIHEFNRNNLTDYSGNSNKDNFTRKHNLVINDKSVRRIQSKLHPVPFSTLRKLIYEIISIQPANVTKANISTESFSLIFETLMAFSGCINVVDIPTVDKYVTSYRYTIEITPFMTMMNILPFPIQIRFQMSSGIKIPVEALALQYNVVPEIKFPNIIAFAENKFKSLAASSTEDYYNTKYMDSDSTNNLAHSNDDGITCNGSINDKSRSQNSILKKLENIYHDEFAILIEFLSGKPVDIILQPQQELALPIFRQKLEMILYINGCPLEGCHFPIYMNTSNSPEYIQAQNALINEFIYRSNKFSVSFPFGDTISHNVSLDRIIGNPYNAWGPFYSKVLQNYYSKVYSGLESNGLKSTNNKLYDCLNHLTVNIGVSSRQIIFSALARIENTTDSILCLFLNENTSLNISSANNTSVPLPLPPFFRYFTSHENMKSLRISSLAITTSLPTFHKYNIQTVANSIKINYTSKISSKIDISTTGVCIPLIKLPLIKYQEKVSNGTSYQAESKSENLENQDSNDTLINTSIYEDNNINNGNSQILTFGVTTYQNDLLSYMNYPVATFYNRCELVSRLPFPILVHKFTTAREMHQKIQSCLNECEDYETLSKEASSTTFIFPETDKQKHSTEFHRIHNNKPNKLESIKLPPITSLSSSILLRPNERRPYHQVNPRIWISKPIINSNEPFLTSRDFSLFSGCKIEYSSQPSKFQVALYPQQQDVRASNGVSGINSSNQIGSTSNKLNSTAKLSNFATPFLLTLHLIPGILGSSTSSAASATIGNSGYFVIFSVAEAPFFKICNLSSYYIAYQTPNTSKVHNYYYRGKKAVFGATSNIQLDNFANENNPDSDIDDIDSSLKNKRIVDVDNTKNCYSYPNLGAAKSADISVIPPHTSIPYIPKDWDCEYIGIMPLNVKKSNWTTHSITSIKDEIYVITFVKYEEVMKVIPATDKLQSALNLEIGTNIENSPKNEAVELQPDYKIQLGNSGVVTDVKPTIVDKNNTQKNSKRIKYGKLYIFLMGTRILIIMENRKSAEKVLSGHFAVLNQNVIESGFEDDHFDFSRNSNIVVNSLSNENNHQVNGLSLSSNVEKTKSSIIQQSAMKYYYISKLSWIGLKFSFFIPRTSVSWIHQNELVIVWHGSLFQIVGSILPDNICSMMILDFTCDLLLRKCMELVGLENSTWRTEHTIKGSFFDIPFRRNEGVALKPLFSDGVASLINNEEKILIPKQNPDIIDLDMGMDIMGTFSNKSINIVDLDENKHFEYIGSYIKKIFLFLSKNIRNMGGSFSVGENHALRQALLLLKRTYKDCILREKFYASKLYLDQKSYPDEVQKQYSSFKIYSRSPSDLKDSKYSLFNSEFKSKQSALLSLYDDTLNSMIQIISLLSNQMESALLINGRFTIKVGLESIHIDHFLPGDIP